jgi:hypothetical protein
MRLLRFVQQTAPNRGRSNAHTRNPPTKRSTAFLFRNTGKPRIAQDTAKITDRPIVDSLIADRLIADRLIGHHLIADHCIVDQDHCTPEKYRMECVGKTCCAANRVRRLPDKNIYWSWRRDLNP